jgi:hypothetical protein
MAIISQAAAVTSLRMMAAPPAAIVLNEQRVG